MLLIFNISNLKNHPAYFSYYSCVVNSIITINKSDEANAMLKCSFSLIRRKSAKSAEQMESAEQKKNYTKHRKRFWTKDKLLNRRKSTEQEGKALNRWISSDQKKIGSEQKKQTWIEETVLNRKK